MRIMKRIAEYPHQRFFEPEMVNGRVMQMHNMVMHIEDTVARFDCRNHALNKLSYFGVLVVDFLNAKLKSHHSPNELKRHIDARYDVTLFPRRDSAIHDVTLIPEGNGQRLRLR